MLETAASTAEANAADAERKLTDGFRLVIEALTLNGIKTIYGVPGIPITDFGRLAQAAGMRVISFRHEQHAGNAAAIAGYLTKKSRRLPHGVGSRLPQRSDGPGQRHDQLLSDDPDQRLVRARDRGPAAGRLRRDGPAGHRQAALQGGVPRAACRGHRHRCRPRDPRRGVRPSGRRLSRSAGQAVRAGDRRGGWSEVSRQGHRSRAGADSCAGRRRACARSAEERQASPDHSRERRGIRASRRPDSQPCRKERRTVSADEHGQGPSARHASAVRRRRTLDGAEGFRRRHADRRPAQLAPVARQGQDLGRRAEEIHPDRHRAEGDGLERRDRRPGGGRHRLLRRRRCSTAWAASGPRRRRTGSTPSRRSARKTSPRWRHG